MMATKQRPLVEDGVQSEVEKIESLSRRLDRLPSGASPVPDGGKNNLLARIRAKQQLAQQKEKSEDIGSGAGLLNLENAASISPAPAPAADAFGEVFNEQPAPPQPAVIPAAAPSFDFLTSTAAVTEEDDMEDLSALYGTSAPAPTDGASELYPSLDVEGTSALDEITAAIPTAVAAPPPELPTESPSPDADIVADPELVEEQRQILEQIKRENSAAATPAPSSAGVASSTVVPVENAQTTGDGRMIELSPGNLVPLYGQEETRAAMARGNAILFQCSGCDGWMRVVNTANFVFCPTCQTVSQVDKKKQLGKQSQESLDAQVAAALQQKYDKEGAAAPPANGVVEGGLSGMMKGMFGYLNDPPVPATVGALRRAPLQTRAPARPTGLGGGAVVAVQQPMYACVVNSITNAAASFGLADTSVNHRIGLDEEDSDDERGGGGYHNMTERLTDHDHMNT